MAFYKFSVTDNVVYRENIIQIESSAAPTSHRKDVSTWQTIKKTNPS